MSGIPPGWVYLSHVLGTHSQAHKVLVTIVKPLPDTLIHPVCLLISSTYRKLLSLMSLSYAVVNPHLDTCWEPMLLNFFIAMPWYQVWQPAQGQSQIGSPIIAFHSRFLANLWG
ncbi:hypothetical protein VNO77_34064 [Canavalia gladiata]|uniref:Uncharacterized protein n=1 Tax=Canavalia gladiata TaxID=3824 RepID=A0AAN9PZH6_CANGL